MKKNILIAAGIILITGISCKTSKTAVESYDTAPDTPAETISAPVETVVYIKSEKEIFEEKTKDIALSINSSPPQTVNGTDFKTPFSVKVKKVDGSPVENFPILVRYPSKNENGNISFSEEELSTDAEGIAVYIPKTPSFSCNTQLDFLPYVPTSDEEVIKAASSLGVSAPWKVRTNLARKGGLIGLVDYNAKGAALADTLSSSFLLKELMNNGFSNIGNFDIPRSMLGDRQAVYKHVNNIVGNSVSYLIYGTIKYLSPVEKNDKTYSCTLEADISCMDIKTGNILYSTVKSVTATDTTEWKVISSARAILAKELGQAIIFNM
ncbi:hypothetical protein HRI96_06585 [Treponema parvum]|uniref:Lipoprotein n=1 Tax=Treponema parvum TaxID=138851 RepID=A0A975ID90_9SPIR|nr:hypothetical protein [Treponema parvum]QTQ11894.1 hypothetical protein HRI96_06585 [Treponema parvum]QTQ16128.1 hypothetical protein HXT04_05165 [Treponema parvum]